HPKEKEFFDECFHHFGQQTVYYKDDRFGLADFFDGYPQHTAFITPSHLPQLRSLHLAVIQRNVFERILFNVDGFLFSHLETFSYGNITTYVPPADIQNETLRHLCTGCDFLTFIQLLNHLPKLTSFKANMTSMSREEENFFSTMDLTVRCPSLTHLSIQVACPIFTHLLNNHLFPHLITCKVALRTCITYENFCEVAQALEENQKELKRFALKTLPHYYVTNPTPVKELKKITKWFASIRTYLWQTDYEHYGQAWTTKKGKEEGEVKRWSWGSESQDEEESDHDDDKDSA
ncbi:unnamed protein product, partial [Rotaria magnacalcarata]